MLTKTEKRMVILLGNVAIINFIMNIFLPFSLGGYYWGFLSILWGFFGIIIENLVVAVLILTIKKE